MGGLTGLNMGGLTGLNMGGLTGVLNVIMQVGVESGAGNSITM